MEIITQQGASKCALFTTYQCDKIKENVTCMGGGGEREKTHKF